ncbi:sensor histidine kinase [Pedobacter foliorum]|uniref:sensor histidine kinase n=1 Tax=Pedobacter foliorum TaxID=2739058 RepID=UPI001566D5C9|nr:sensor histidine kinase [Pedobacter foliorum]NRF41114.1 sensor histidine kinase [Pedobacter foliorum]
MKRINTLTEHVCAWMNRNRFHFLVWGIFIVLESLMISLATGIYGDFLSYLLHYAINIGLFYVNAQVVLPKALKKPIRRLWLTPLLIALEVLLYLAISYVIDLLLASFASGTSINNVPINRHFLYGSIWRALEFLGFSWGYYYLSNYFKQLKTTAMLENQALERIIVENEMTIELARTKNAYLRAQVNPHLLFNTLNFIFNQVRKNNTIVAGAVLLLSEIMRFAIEQDQESGLKPLKEEIKQTRNLINLWQIRQREPNYIDFEVAGDIENFSFLPLVLLTLTENVFKHGDLTKHDHPTNISITLEDGLFRMVTDNLIAAKQPNEGFHSGLDNIRQRLAYTFSEAASIKYEITDRNHFLVVIDLRLSE